MEAVKTVFFFAFFAVISTFAVSAEFSVEQEQSISALFEILSAVYDYDSSLVPDEPNEILALETSQDSRDQLAWAIFKMLKYESDPNSKPIDETTPAITDMENISVTALIENADPNAGSQSLASNSQITANGSGIESIQQSEPFEELSNPLGSCIIPSGTYRITTLPLRIEGHVVIPAGTRFIAPFDPNNAVIEVMPGGLLETGKAAYYGEDEYPDILPAVEIVPQDPNIFFYNNYAGIYVHRGADLKTRLENLEITGCTIGIVVDESLVYPLRNVITVGCYDGVHLYAPAGIVDCQFWFNGSVYDGIFGYAGAGVYVCLDGCTYPFPVASISRTTIYNGDVGLYFEGSIPDPNLPDPNQIIPTVEAVNSCFALNYFYGIYKSQGQSSVNPTYCAFGGNEYDVNFEAPFAGCVGLEYNPFYILGQGKKLYIYQWSEMIDAGYGIATDGTGTCHYQPDVGIQDIGCHFALGVAGGFGIPSSPADFNWDGIVDEQDLELMNFCMGAIADPNIVKIDTNYDSRVNLPDFGIFSFDYGYASDPNASGNNDPNCQRSDFNTDHRVDLADLDVLAQHWLTVVMDEYRICSLCDLYEDPNAMNAINADDMNVFMADWMKIFTSDPNIAITQSASQLSVAVQNPDPAWKITAFLDDEPIGQWSADWVGSTVFDADLTRYGPGSHKVKVVRCIGPGQEITETVVSDPNSVGLYFADVPDTFEANQPYIVSGFNLTDELSLKIDNISGCTVYDVNVPSGAVNLAIPAAVFSNIQLCQLSLFKINAGLSSPDSEDQEVGLKTILYKKFNRQDYNGKQVRAVILLPDIRVSSIFSAAIQSWANALDQLQTSYVVLSLFDVEKGNLKFLLSEMPGRRIVIYFGHANAWAGRDERNGIEGVQRTRFQCFEQRKTRYGEFGWPSPFKMSYYWDVSALSYTQQSVPNAELLPSDGDPYNPHPLDQVGLDLRKLDLWDSPKIDQAYIFGCLSARFPDLASAFGAFSLHNYGSHDQVFVGFREAVLQGTGAIWGGVADKLIEGLVIIGEELSRGKTLQQAIAKTEEADAGVRRALWGENGYMDAEPDGDDVVFLYGYGFLSNIYLR